MNKKLKIAFFSDHPLVPSGIGTQANYLIQGLLATGKFSFVCIGGAVHHQDYRTVVVDPEKFGNDWRIIPVDGYGSKDLVRKLIQEEKPDAFFIFTDPRFWGWLWEMEDEVRAQGPLLYWHVWDNDPIPKFNSVFYRSNDFVSAISLKTYGILQDLRCVPFKYIPHAVSDEIFKPLPSDEIDKFRKEKLGPHADKKFIVFWNNRNARRKQPGDVIAAFAAFAKKVGKQNVSLMMHTQVGDPEGQPLLELARSHGVDECFIVSEQRVPSEILNQFYNAVDVTINIASNEGFGLGTLESLSAGTPIIAQMTGGLQYQMGNWYEGFKNFDDQSKLTEIARKKWESRSCDWWGVPIFPASRSLTGSQQIPYIFDDRVNHDDVVKGLVHLYEMGREGRKALGLRARAWVQNTFRMSDMVSSWERVIEGAHEKWVAEHAPTTESFRTQSV